MTLPPFFSKCGQNALYFIYMPDNENAIKTAENSLPKTMVVGDFTVSKFVLRDFTGLFGSIESIIKHLTPKLADAGELSNEAAIGLIVAEIPFIFDELVPILAKATGVSEDHILDNAGIDDAGEIVIAIFEVNNFSGLWGSLKKKVPYLATLQEEGKKALSDGIKK